MFHSNLKGSKCDACGYELTRDFQRIPDCARCPKPASVYVTQLSENDYLWQCRNCEWTHRTENNEPVEHRCGRKEVVRLGDRVEAALSAVGITQERWLGVKEEIGLPRTCQCRERKAWLNELDKTLGLGEKLSAFKKAMGWQT